MGLAGVRCLVIEVSSNRYASRCEASFPVELRRDPSGKVQTLCTNFDTGVQLLTQHPIRVEISLGRDRLA